MSGPLERLNHHIAATLCADGITMFYETPEEYAQRQADNTRKVYVITAVGNVFGLVGNRDLYRGLRRRRGHVPSA